MNWYVKVLKQYADFKGRARRKELWMFILFNMIITYGITFLSIIIEVPQLALVGTFYSLAVMIPTFAVWARRMHDTGNSAWLMLIPIYNFVLACTDSVPKVNKWGENPKGIGNDTMINQIGKE